MLSEIYRPSKNYEIIYVTAAVHTVVSSTLVSSVFYVELLVQMRYITDR